MDTKKWEILYSGVASAQQHMDIDQKLLQDISNIGHPILRFYDWDGPSATYGYFIDPMKHLDSKGIEKLGLKLGRRPTGGGLVFHLTDLAFSVLIPACHPAYSTNTLQNYAFINEHVARAIINFKKGISITFLPEEKKAEDAACQYFCMAKPTIYDVMVDGKKVGGAAQRRTREGFLHQGTISIALPDEAFLNAVLRNRTIFEAMKQHSYGLIGAAPSEQLLKDVRDELRELLEREFTT